MKSKFKEGVVVQINRVVRVGNMVRLEYGLDDYMLVPYRGLAKSLKARLV